MARSELRCLFPTNCAMPQHCIHPPPPPLTPLIPRNAQGLVAALPLPDDLRPRPCRPLPACDAPQKASFPYGISTFSAVPDLAKPNNFHWAMDILVGRAATRPCAFLGMRGVSGGGGVCIQCCVIAKFVEKRQRNSERANPGTPGFIRNKEMMNATQKNGTY